MAGVGEVSGAKQLVVRLDLLDEVVAAVDFACVAFRVAEVRHQLGDVFALCGDIQKDVPRGDIAAECVRKACVEHLSEHAAVEQLVAVAEENEPAIRFVSGSVAGHAALKEHCGIRQLVAEHVRYAV